MTIDKHSIQWLYEQWQWYYITKTLCTTRTVTKEKITINALQWPWQNKYTVKTWMQDNAHNIKTKWYTMVLQQILTINAMVVYHDLTQF